jgi:hypothetical protein
MVYLGILGEIAAGLGATIGEKKAAKTLSRVTAEISVSMLDEKSQKDIIGVFESRAKKAERLGDYDAMREHIFGKWALFGIDSKDLDFASRKLGKLMKLGRPFDALDYIAKINEYFDDDQIEHQIGMVQQAFKNISGAIVADRKEFDMVIKKCEVHLGASVDLLTSKKLVSKNESLATLCNILLSSTVKFMDNFVKRSGKSVAAEAVYPLLHEIIKPLILQMIDILTDVGIEKSKNAAASKIRKIKSDSTHKKEILRVIESKW